MSTNQTSDFDLTTATGWAALGAEWRVRRADWEAAVQEHRRLESEAQTLSSGATKAERVAIEARLGLKQADQRSAEASDLEADSVDAALSTPAPSVFALLLKLEMVDEPHGWNAFDDETWTTFLADLRRFLPNAQTQAA